MSEIRQQRERARTPNNGTTTGFRVSDPAWATGTRINSITATAWADPSNTWLAVTIANAAGNTIAGYMAASTLQAAYSSCLTQLPGFVASPTPAPTPTPIPTANIWYVTCHNLTGPLNVWSQPVAANGTLLGQLAPGSQVIRVDTTTSYTDGTITRVPIYWSQQPVVIGYTALSDSAHPTDGDHLSQPRDPDCSPASATPLPTNTPTPPPPTPTYPTDSPGRFGQGVLIQSPFSEPPAVVGACGIHDVSCFSSGGATIDIIPRSVEKCVDTIANCDPTPIPTGEPTGAGIPIYAPTDGCTFFYHNQPTELTLRLDCKSITPPTWPDPSGTPVVGYRELYFSHIILSTNLVNAGSVKAGTLIGYACTQANRKPCNYDDYNGLSPIHFGVEFRFYNQRKTGIATSDEVRGFLATPNCLYDDWQYQPGTQTDWTKPPVSGNPEQQSLGTCPIP